MGILGGFEKHRWLYTFYLISFLCFPTKSSADQMASILNLMNSFGSGCTVHERQSQILFNTTRSLSASLKSLINDDSCKSLSALAVETQNSLDRINLQAPLYTTSELRYQKLKARREALLSAIQVESDGGVKTNFENELRNLQIDIAEIHKEHDLEKVNEKTAYLHQAANSYRASAESLLNLLVRNDECLQRHPGVTETIGSVGLSLAQSSTLGVATSGASILAGAGINTVSRLVNLVRERSNNSKLKKFSDPLLPTALSCTLENLNSIYCDSDKIETLARFSLSPMVKNLRAQNSTPFLGLTILERAVPSLDSSLSLIKIGSDPSSAQDGSRRKAIRQELEHLQGNKLVLSGFLADLQRQLGTIQSGLPSDERRRQILRLQKIFISDFLSSTGVHDDTDGTGGISANSGLNSIYTGQKARYYLYGFDPVKVNIRDTAKFISFRDVALPEAYTDDTQNPWKVYSKGEDTVFIEDFGQFEQAVRRRFQSWSDEALADLDAKRNLIFNTDKKEILASFDRPSSRDYRSTPLLSIASISDFFKDPNNLKYLTPKDLVIANEVVHTIETGILEPLASVSMDPSGGTFEEDANKAFKKVLLETKYADDSRFLINRINSLINRIVSEASIELYREGRSEFIYALASDNTVKELLSYVGREKTTVDVIYDAHKTKGQTIAVINAFVEAFQEPLKTSLEQLSKPEELKRRAVERGHLCLQLYGLVNNSKSKINDLFVKYCLNATLPEIAGAPAAPIFTTEIWNQPVESRICLHQNWQRKILLLENGLD